MVNRKKLALVAAGQSRRRIPSTDAIQEWLDLVIEEDPHLSQEFDIQRRWPAQGQGQAVAG